MRPDLLNETGNLWLPVSLFFLFCGNDFRQLSFGSVVGPDEDEQYKCHQQENNGLLYEISVLQFGFANLQ
jgi:hypothetical protein